MRIHSRRMITFSFLLKLDVLPVELNGVCDKILSVELYDKQEYIRVHGIISWFNFSGGRNFWPPQHFYWKQQLSRLLSTLEIQRSDRNHLRNNSDKLNISWKFTTGKSHYGNSSFFVLHEIFTSPDRIFISGEGPSTMQLFYEVSRFS